LGIEIRHNEQQEMEGRYALNENKMKNNFNDYVFTLKKYQIAFFII
jgi:hypothetical protein